MGFYKANSANLRGGTASVLIAATSYPLPGRLSEICDLTTYVPNTATYGWINIGDMRNPPTIDYQVTMNQWKTEQLGTIRNLITDWMGTAKFEMAELTQANKALVAGAIAQTDPIAGQHRTNWTARNAVPYVHLCMFGLSPDGQLHAVVASKAQWDGSALSRAFSRADYQSMAFTHRCFPDSSTLDAITGDPLIFYDLQSD